MLGGRPDVRSASASPSGLGSDASHADQNRTNNLSTLHRGPGHFQQILDDHQALGSIGSVGDAYDNAMAESFVDSFKTELIADRVWRTRSQLELAIVEYVGWFNCDRLHESLGDRPPAEIEALYAAQTEPTITI